MSIKPVYTDGVLYVMIAVCGFLSTEAGSDAAYKYLNPYFLFWAKVIIGCLLAGATALKMFRSTSYSNHIATTPTPEGDSTIVHTTTTVASEKSTLTPIPPTQQPQNLNTKV